MSFPGLLIFAAVQFPPSWYAPVGSYALYAGASVEQRLFRGISETLRQQHFRLRLALVGKEVRKERRKRRNEQTYYWVEINYQKKGEEHWLNLKLLIHEDDLRSGKALEAVREYILQKADEVPRFVSVDSEADRRWLREFRFLHPLLPLRTQEAGSVPYFLDGRKVEARWIRFRGEGVLRETAGAELAIRRVRGRALVSPIVPFGLVRLEYTEDILRRYPRAPQPERQISTLTLGLVDSGADAKSWIRREPPDLRTQD